MKTFIASLITFLIILLSVTGYLFFLNHTIGEFITQIDKILVELESEDWMSVTKSYDDLSANWEKNKNWLEAFSNHSKTDHIGILLAEMKKMIDYNDKKQLEISADKIKLLLYFIYDDELPTIENIV